MLVNRKAFNNDVNDFLVDYEGLENRWNRLNYEEKRAWIIETYGPYPKISERFQKSGKINFPDHERVCALQSYYMRSSAYSTHSSV